MHVVRPEEADTVGDDLQHAAAEDQAAAGGGGLEYPIDQLRLLQAVGMRYLQFDGHPPQGVDR